MNEYWTSYTFNLQDLDALFYIFSFLSVNRCCPSAEAVVQAIGDPAVVTSLIAHGYLQTQGALLVPIPERIWRALRLQRRARRKPRLLCWCS